MIIESNDIDEALYLTSKQLLQSSEISPRKLKTKELIMPQIIINNPELCVIQNPSRKLSIDYLQNELNWYLTGDLNADYISQFAKIWENIRDNEGNVNSNYGFITFKQQLENVCISQYDWVIKSLTDDKNSRQAVINFNQTKHKYYNNKDFVCTINTHYLIRNDELIGITNMRSNDLIYGFSYDFPFFSFLQQKIVHDLKSVHKNLKLGKNIHTATSLHVYEKHFKMLENICDNYEQNKYVSKSLNEIIQLDI